MARVPVWSAGFFIGYAMPQTTLDALIAQLRHASAGDVVRLVPGVYPLTGAVELPPELHDLTIDARGVVLDEREPIVGPAVTAKGWGGVRWLGGELIGADSESRLRSLIQTAAKESRELAGDEYGLGFHVEDCDGCEFTGLQITGKDRGLAVVRGEGCRVERLDYLGHYSGVSKFDDAGLLVPEIKDLARLSYAVSFLGGRHHRVNDIRVERAGGAVVAGSSAVLKDGTKIAAGLPRYLNVRDVRGKLLGDNGVYISSGEHVTVERCILEQVLWGHAAKARGSFNEIIYCRSIDCYAGFLLESVGKDQGNPSRGSRIERCRVHGATDFGFGLDNNGPVFGRGFQYLDNEIYDSLHKPISRFPAVLKRGRAAFDVGSGEEITVDGNVIDGCAGDVWGLFGSESAPIDGLLLGRNFVRRTATDMRAFGRIEYLDAVSA